MTERNPNSLMARLADAEPAPPWSVTAAAITIGIAFIAVVIGTLVGAVWFAGASFASLVGWLVGALLVIPFITQSRRTKADREALRLGAPGVSLVFVVFISIGFAVLFDLIALAITGGQFLPRPELAALDAFTPSLADGLVAGALVLVAQPVAYGLAFFGIAFPAIRALFGGVPGWIATAAVYAVFRFAAYPPNYLAATGIAPLVYGLLLPFLDGLVIGAVRARTLSTRAAVAAHAAFGVFALLKLFAVTAT